MNKEKSNRIRTKPSKFGWRIYDGSQKVQVTEVEVYVCPVCKETSKLVQRQAPGFKNILSICQHGHTCEIVKTVYEKYKVGDRIRSYESTLGKNSVVRLDSYSESVIEKSYPGLIDWMFDFRIDRCVGNGKEITAPAWVIGHLSVGRSHHDKSVVLVKKQYLMGPGRNWITFYDKGEKHDQKRRQN